MDREHPRHERTNVTEGLTRGFTQPYLTLTISAAGTILGVTEGQ